MNTYELVPETHVPKRERGGRQKSIRSATVDRFLESDMDVASIEFATVSEATNVVASMAKYIRIADLPVEIKRRRCKVYLSKIH